MNSLRIAIATTLLAIVSMAVFVWMSSQREQRIARKIESLGGRVYFNQRGPKWNPLPMLLDRIRQVDFEFVDKAVPLDLLSELGSLPDLEILILQNSQISDEALKYFRDSRKLLMLDLGNTQITDAGLRHLKGLDRLATICLQHTRVTDTGLEYLEGLVNLEYIRLKGTLITDAGLEHLKGLSKLKGLALDDTQVTDAGLDHLKGLTNLKLLYINDTQVTAKGKALLPGCKITPEPQ